MTKSAARFFRDESGVSAIEYPLISAGMAVAVITMIGLLSDGLSGMASSLASKMTIQ